MIAARIRSMIAPWAGACLAVGAFLLVAEAARVADGREGEAAAVASRTAEPLSPEGYGERSWTALVASRSGASARPFAIAWGGALLVAAAWGLGLAPWQRRGGLLRWIAIPFQLLGSVPGVWFATLAAMFVYFHWDRPGYADEVAVASGLDLVSWWNAAVVALPAACAAIAAHLGAIEAAWRDSARSATARGMLLAGVPGDRVRLRYLLRERLAAHLALLDHALGPLIGLLVFAEWALRYEGLGALLVDCALHRAWDGLLAAGLALLTFAFAVSMLRRGLESLVADGEGGAARPDAGRGSASG